MIVTIRRVWPGEKRTTIIAIDQADQREKSCFVWMDTPKGQFIASLCQRLENNGRGMSEQQVVLTVRPKTRWGYQIDDAELLPAEAVGGSAHGRTA